MAQDDYKHGKHNPAGLTKNEKLVWEVLLAGTGPLKAYEILDILKEKGVRAPMTIYRALDGLEERGLIHKIDGINSFLPCRHDKPHAIQAFLVCVKCSGVEEIHLDSILSDLMPVVHEAKFQIQTARFEVNGACSKCIA